MNLDYLFSARIPARKIILAGTWSGGVHCKPRDLSTF